MKSRPFRWSALVGGIVTACLLHASPVRAQNADPGDGSDNGYRTGENRGIDAEPQGNFTPPLARPQDQAAPDAKAEGPVRMARFSYVHGNVTWRADAGMDWSQATVNLPMREGAQIWVTDGGRADVQFDDGSEIRLGNGALATLKVLFSDSQGEFTQITLNSGLATLHSRHPDSVYQIDTPLVSVKTTNQSQVRFGIGNGSEVAVQRGSATIEGHQGKFTLQQDDYVFLPDADAAYEPHRIPVQDAWDRWNADRNQIVDGKSSDHIPANIGLVSGELDDYGEWHNDAKYGWVWCPRVTDTDWRPYYHGHWVWVDPFGWTWVGEEPWGWAPYHYGSWVELSTGWGWCPGPRVQYWSPGVVGFSVYAGNVCWAPLCPWEVRYPSAFAFGIGFGGRDWAFSFSIGCAGIYYPRDRWCEGRPFDNFAVNRWHGDRFGNGFHEGLGNHNEFVGDHHFVPYNASHGAGAVVASAEAFGGRGGYRAVGRGDSSYFTRGQSVGAPSAGRNPTSGPATVRPTLSAMTPTRTFTPEARPSQAALQRGVYHASLPASVQRSLTVGSSHSTNSAAYERPRSSGGSGGYTGASAANQARTSMDPRIGASSGSGRYTGESASGRPRSSTDPSTGSYSGSGRNASGQGAYTRGSSAAEAARQARESVGVSSRGQGGTSSGGYGGSTGGRSYSGGSERSGSGSPYSGSNDRNSGRTYSGPSDRGYSGSSDRYSGSTPRSSGGSVGSSSGGYSRGSGGAWRNGESSGRSPSGSYSGSGRSSGGGNGGGSHGGGNSSGGSHGDSGGNSHGGRDH